MGNLHFKSQIGMSSFYEQFSENKDCYYLIYNFMNSDLQAMIESHHKNNDIRRENREIKIKSIDGLNPPKITIESYQYSLLEYCQKNSPSYRDIDVASFINEWGREVNPSDPDPTFQYDQETIIRSFFIMPDRKIKAAPYIGYGPTTSRARSGLSYQENVKFIYFLTVSNAQETPINELILQLLNQAKTPNLSIVKDRLLTQNSLFRRADLDIQLFNILIDTDSQYFIKGQLQPTGESVCVQFYQNVFNPRIDLINERIKKYSQQACIKRVYRAFIYFFLEVVVVEYDENEKDIQSEILNRKSVQLEEELKQFLEIVKLLGTLKQQSILEDFNNISSSCLKKINHLYMLDFLSATQFEGRCISPYYPPEALNSSAAKGEETYAWVLGQLLYEMITGTTLIPRNENEIVAELQNYDDRKYLSKVQSSFIQFTDKLIPKDIQYLINSLIRPQPQQRLSLDRLIQEVQQLSITPVQREIAIFDYQRLANTKLIRPNFTLVLSRYKLNSSQEGLFEAEITDSQGVKSQVDVIVSLKLSEIEEALYSQISSNKLVSENLVRVLDMFPHGDLKIVVLEKEESNLANEMGRLANSNAYEVRKAFIDICGGVRELHKRKYAHQELRLENIILANKRFKLRDFSTLQDVLKPISSERVKKLSAYTAPEVIKRSSLNEQSDIWCLGHLYYQMITGKLLFQDFQPEALELELWCYNEDICKAKMADTIIGADRQQRIPVQTQQLILKMLRENPEQRITIEEVIQEMNPRIVFIPKQVPSLVQQT